MEHDVNTIIDVIAAAGTQFSGVAKKIDSCDHTTLSQWVLEALDVVYKGIVPPNINVLEHENDVSITKTLGASVEACMVIALIAQWLVRFMCKKLMQLMTPEAAILKRKYATNLYYIVCIVYVLCCRSIPTSYLKIYLNFQCHFSLKELITKHIQLLQQWY